MGVELKKSARPKQQKCLDSTCGFSCHRAPDLAVKPQGRGVRQRHVLKPNHLAGLDIAHQHRFLQQADRHRLRVIRHVHSMPAHIKATRTLLDHSPGLQGFLATAPTPMRGDAELVNSSGAP